MVSKRLHTPEGQLTSLMNTVTGTEIALPSTSGKPTPPPRRDSIPMLELNVTQQTIQETVMLYTSGPVSLKERLLYTLNKLFVKQVKSFLLLLDLDPFILLSSSHNIKYIKFTSP